VPWGGLGLQSRMRLNTGGRGGGSGAAAAQGDRGGVRERARWCSGGGVSD
jgi:hypothetical protein